MENKRINKISQMLIAQIVLTVIGGIILLSILTIMVLSRFPDILTPTCNADESTSKAKIIIVDSDFILQLLNTIKNICNFSINMCLSVCLQPALQPQIAVVLIVKI